MLKKVVVIMAIAILFIGFFSTFSVVNADAMDDVLSSSQATELIEIKESTKGKIAEYVEKYGSKTFGFVAFILNGVRIYSIPFCFIGIAVGSIFQYVICIRRLDVRDKGFMLIITFVTILLICQVLPLVFAIVVNGWRG